MDKDKRKELIASFGELTGCQIKIDRASKDPLDLDVQLIVLLDTKSGGAWKTVLADTEKNRKVNRLLSNKGFSEYSRTESEDRSVRDDDWTETHYITEGLTKTYDTPEDLLKDLERIVSYSKGVFDGVGLG